MKTKTYSIKEIESATGIKAHTIRIWEKRYKILDPIRTNTNIRRYSEDEYKKMVNISILYNFGWKISKIARLNSKTLQSYCDEALKKQIGSYAEMAELLMLITENRSSDFEELLKSYLIRFDKIKVAISIISPLTQRLNLLGLTKKMDKTVEQYYLNKLLFYIFEITSSIIVNEKEINDSILILQSDSATIPVNPAIVRLLAISRSYETNMFTNVIRNEDIPKLKKYFEPNIVFTEFNQSVSDNIFKKRVRMLSDTFSKQRVIVTGKKAELLVEDLPVNVRFIKNIYEMKSIL